VEPQLVAVQFGIALRNAVASDSSSAKPSTPAKPPPTKVT
jgi:hypothetical protein